MNAAFPVKVHFTDGISNDICGVFEGLFGVNTIRVLDVAVYFSERMHPNFTC